MYGTPAYRSIDPTPLLGISFLAMFGLMFGDVGHGLVLALIGALMCFKGKQAGLKQAGLLLVLAGSASMVFGFLFGSIFGFEEALPTLWLKPMESISRLFSSAIYFGIGLIFVSIAVNVINGIRKRDFLGTLFDKAGILAAVFYWCGIFTAIRVLSAGSIPGVVIVLLLSSIVLLFFREPILHLAEGKKHLFPEGLATGIIGGFVEILEIFLGFLANSVSFIRVAAFGLAHAGLFMAVFALSKAMGGGAGSVAIQIFGNIGIIALEGMVVTIQVVRLEFYEFFSRFFQQGEKAYQPVGFDVK
jgi:V/A-type H+-transporting ATPase subunit I